MVVMNSGANNERVMFNEYDTVGRDVLRNRSPTGLME